VKVLLRGPLSPYSGYGRDGIGIALALLERGHQVSLSPTHTDPPLPREIAGLLTQPIEPPYDLALHHQEPERAELTLENATAARHNVLWTMWDWSRLPEQEWVPTWEDRTRYYDHIVGYTPTTLKAFAPVTSDAADRLKVVLGGYTSAEWTEPYRAPTDLAGPVERPFTFGMNGRLTVRKGVYTAYTAFYDLCERFPEWNLQLVLHSTEALFPPTFEVHPRVKVVHGRWLTAQSRDFYAHLDCYLAPSLAESKNLPPIEALTMGVPAILSDIPGHRAWATSDMVTFLPTDKASVVPGFTGDLVKGEDLITAMENAYLNREAARRQADVARRVLPAMLDWTKCLERLGQAVGLRL
jgi:glycosyltransferase involved in cell wall biosynthesis